MRYVLLACLVGCAGESGTDTFTLRAEIGCRHDGCPPVDAPIAVGFSQRIGIYSDAYYYQGIGNELRDRRDRKTSTISRPVENVSFEIAPPDMFTATLDGDALVVTAHRPGIATLTVKGTVRGTQSKTVSKLVAVRAGGTKFEIANLEVAAGEEIVLARGVKYLAFAHVYDERGNRLVHDVEPSPKDGPLWTRDNGGWSYVWSDRLGVFDLPAAPGTKAGRVRIVEPKLSLARPDAIHANVIARDDRGNPVPLGFVDRVALSPDCGDGSDQIGLYAKAGTLLMERGFDPKLTCELELRPETTPRDIYPAFRVVLPLQPSPELLPRS